MKFYEFNKFEYYALIGAENQDEAIKVYRLNVAYIPYEKDEIPDEITKEKAWEKFKEAVDSQTLCTFEEDILKDFNYQVNNSSVALLLIDKSL